MNQQDLEKFFLSLGEKSFRSKQVYQWIHQKGVSDFYAMTNISKELQEKLSEKAEISAPKVSFRKGLKRWNKKMGAKCWRKAISWKWCLFLKVKEQRFVYPPKSDVRLIAVFVLPAKQGFSRNLEISEIIGQLWVAENSFGVPRDHANKKVTNVVMMGMGEPLLNFDAVTGAMSMMMDDKAYGLSKRKVTLSTSGLVPLN